MPEDLGKVMTYEASGDLSANQFRFVKIDTNGQVALCGDGQHADGVLQNKPAAQARAAQVAKAPSRTKVVAGDVTTKGALVASDGNGKAVVAVTGDHVLGKFLEAAGAADQVVAIDFNYYSETLA